ncbi:hypothetical protein FPV67DRAFT_1444416 [Lyophyllum atratum]|nr:hypothetical protein FPV67DRAFT_1444416 [Lyophyllum atratum]
MSHQAGNKSPLDMSMFPLGRKVGARRKVRAIMRYTWSRLHLPDRKDWHNIEEGNEKSDIVHFGRAGANASSRVGGPREIEKYKVERSYARPRGCEAIMCPAQCSGIKLRNLLYLQTAADNHWTACISGLLSSPRSSLKMEQRVGHMTGYHDQGKAPSPRLEQWPVNRFEFPTMSIKKLGRKLRSGVTVSLEIKIPLSVEDDEPMERIWYHLTSLDHKSNPNSICLIKMGFPAKFLVSVHRYVSSASGESQLPPTLEGIEARPGRKDP